MYRSWELQYQGAGRTTQLVMLVTTRAQQKREEAARATSESEGKILQVSPGGTPESLRSSVPERSSDTEEEEAPWEQLDDDLFKGGKPRRYLTWSQKQANRYAWRAWQGGPDEETSRSLDLTAERLQCLQESDETLAAARRAAKGETNSEGKGFFLWGRRKAWEQWSNWFCRNHVGRPCCA